MRELEVVFTKSKKKFPIFSYLIRLWTKQPYSHVARKLKIKDWEPGYYQASEGKVNYEGIDIFEKKHIPVLYYRLSVTDEVYSDIGKHCFEESGNIYAYLQNLGIVLVDTLGFFGIKVLNPFKKGRNCSEILYASCFKVLDDTLDYDENTIKPHHIVEIIENKFKDIIIKKLDYDPCIKDRINN